MLINNVIVIIIIIYFQLNTRCTARAEDIVEKQIIKIPEKKKIALKSKQSRVKKK